MWKSSRDGDGQGDREAGTYEGLSCISTYYKNPTTQDSHIEFPHKFRAHGTRPVWAEEDPHSPLL